MSKTVYLVTSGEQSDFTPEAVFSSRELAETAIVANHADPKQRWRFNDDIDGIELDPTD